MGGGRSRRHGSLGKWSSRGARRRLSRLPASGAPAAVGPRGHRVAAVRKELYHVDRVALLPRTDGASVRDGVGRAAPGGQRVRPGDKRDGAPERDRIRLTPERGAFTALIVTLPAKLL